MGYAIPTLEVVRRANEQVTLGKGEVRGKRGKSSFIPREKLPKVEYDKDKVISAFNAGLKDII